MKVLTAEAMAAADQRAIVEIGVPGLVLMENAALGVVEAIGESFPDVQRISVLCGPGNNGGDGLAVARHLMTRDCLPRVVMVVSPDRLRGDALLQLEIVERLGLAVHVWEEEVSVSELIETTVAPRGCELIVDAMFGTGLARPLEGRLAELVGAINELPLPVVAVDLPSGLHGSRFQLPGPHLRADLTVTFAAPKVAHVLSPALESCGEVVVADLGLPRFLVEEAEGQLFVQSAEELRGLIEPRAAESHKGSYGHLLVVAGAPGTTGAAAMAVRSALRSGVGLVTAAVAEPLVPILEAVSLESMTLPVPHHDSGALGERSLELLLEAAAARSAMVVGPGLGRAPSTEEMVRSLVLDSERPLVLDADGINAFEGQASMLAERAAGDRESVVLTPHPGELARLLEVPGAEIQADRPRFVSLAARETGAVVVLKGHQTLIADPDGDVVINPTGNPGMASGGTGDVLAGVIGALLAQGYDPRTASRLGCFVHGLAGDLSAERVGELSLVAGDLIEMLPQAFATLVE